MNMPNWLNQKNRRIWAIFCLAIKKFSQIDGIHWAGAFAFNAFFSVFPLLVLLVTIASFFTDQERAGKKVITYLEGYVTLSVEMQGHIFATVAEVIKTREQAGLVALVILIWVGLQCFITLIRATNRAWETTGYKWWKLPLKSLMLLGITAGAVLLGMAVPLLLKMAQNRPFQLAMPFTGSIAWGLLSFPRWWCSSAWACFIGWLRACPRGFPKPGSPPFAPRFSWMRPKAAQRRRKPF